MKSPPALPVPIFLPWEPAGFSSGGRVVMPDCGRTRQLLTRRFSVYNIIYKFVNCSAETSTAGFPLQPRNSPPPKTRKRRKKRPTKAEKAKHADEEEEVNVEESERRAAKRRRTVSSQNVMLANGKKSSSGNGKKFQRADCCVY